MNVFIIESPLQLINALEAKAYFKLRDHECDLLILNGENPNTLKQMVRMVDYSKWRKVKELGFGSGRLSWVTRMITLKNQYQNYKNVEMVFIGDYRADVMRDFVTVVNPKQAVLLDDGTVSLRIHKSLSSKREREHFFEREHNGKLKQLIKSLVYFGKTPKQNHIKDLIFFTVYDLSSNDYLTVIKNKYNHIKMVSSNKEKKNEVWFLGSPLAEKGIVPDRKTYQEYLEIVQSHYREYDIYYVPHRAEDPSNIEEYRKLGYKIVKPDMSIEFYLMAQKSVPLIVASFYSSALGNIYNIFGEEIQIDSFLINPSDLPEKNRKEIGDIYNYYEKIINLVKM